MKLTYILLALALLMPLAFSTTSGDGDTHPVGEAIGVASQNQDHAQNDAFKASEKVFVGSLKSDKYNYPDCSAAKRIKLENEIWFSNSADARAHGYVPCGICHPQ